MFKASLIAQGGILQYVHDYLCVGFEVVLAGVTEEDCEFVAGIRPSEFERIQSGESAAMLAQEDAQLNKL